MRPRPTPTHRMNTSTARQRSDTTGSLPLKPAGVSPLLNETRPLLAKKLRKLGVVRLARKVAHTAGQVSVNLHVLVAVPGDHADDNGIVWNSTGAQQGMSSRHRACAGGFRQQPLATCKSGHRGANVVVADCECQPARLADEAQRIAAVALVTDQRVRYAGGDRIGVVPGRDCLGL